jgi:hypothetical protein
MASASASDGFDEPVVVESCPRTLVLLPHEGKVFVDMHDGKFVLAHIQTLRRQAIPSSFVEPDVVIGDDGFGALMDMSDPSKDPILLEDFLTRRLYQSSRGERWVTDVGLDRKAGSQWSLSQKLCELTTMTVSVRVGGADTVLDIFRMSWPRGSYHLMWPAPWFYKFMGLKSYKQQPSKWVYETAATWSNS